jgi:hypothetical protein
MGEQQSNIPGQVVPERTPGTAPSVVPLPKGADPSRPDEHPLPEEAIEGYPKVLGTEAAPVGGGEEKSEPDPKPAPKTTAASGAPKS